MEEDKKQRHQVGDIALKVQHLAAAYGIGRYITFPSIKFGENLDNAAYAVMQTVDQVKDIAQYVEDTVQKIALKLGAEVRAGHSMLEDIATQMEYDIQSEMQTNTDSSLQEQLSTLKEFRTQLDVYFNSSEQTLQDITHTLRQSAIKTADVTDQIKPESGPINYLTEVKEKLFGKLGAPTGEVHRIDQASAEQEYADLLTLTGDIERALTQVSERYQGSKKDFAAREAWISKSNE
ncbi:hypothetical protein H6503_05450, partial [Candidatus Woesearchaeota archaeon]|nr:hypothetical protein [Candidatus Woesearchaeota archaeon]